MSRPKLAAPQWPKQLPELTEKQQEIRKDFYELWLETLPRKYKMLEHFDHSYPAKRAKPGERTLDVGAGLGTQLEWEDLETQNYVAVDLRENHLAELRQRYPQVETAVADVQERLPFEDSSFDRVNAIHVLEHLPNLPPALREIHRVLKPGGRLIVLIPCEQGLMHRFARQISARPLFERRYPGESYDWFVATEHCNLPWEVIHELERLYAVTQRRYFPFLIPSISLNLVIGLTCEPIER